MAKISPPEQFPKSGNRFSDKNCDKKKGQEPFGELSETKTTLSPKMLAPKILATLPPLDGVRLAVFEVGMKYKNRPDLLFLIFDEPAEVAGVFTTSRCPSAPVDHCRQNLRQAPRGRGLVVNAGNANAFTGKRGEEACQQTAEAAARLLGCCPQDIYLASTGVIGEPLEAGKITAALPLMAAEAREDGWLNGARAIMTTDTFAKVATREVTLDGTPVRLNAIAKGSGMIAPDMATMLAFVVTDAPIEAELLQTLLREATELSFNAITVDSDTSTSDTLLVFATGKAGERGVKPLMDRNDPRVQLFGEALHKLLLDLALQIVRDGEGATKLIEVHVSGATSRQAAKKIALSIANSPLVKTAVAGEDANWGRVVMAVGKAGEEADRDKLSIWFGDIRVATQGERDQDYREELAAAVMKGDEICIRVDLGLGQAEARVWGCDLSAGYVEINGSYRS